MDRCSCTACLIWSPRVSLATYLSSGLGHDQPSRLWLSGKDITYVFGGWCCDTTKPQSELFYLTVHKKPGHLQRHKVRPRKGRTLCSSICIDEATLRTFGVCSISHAATACFYIWRQSDIWVCLIGVIPHPNGHWMVRYVRCLSWMVIITQIHWNLGWPMFKQTNGLPRD